MAKVKEKIEKDVIYDDLKGQLDKKGTHSAYTENLLQDYLSMYYAKELLVKDISDNGVKITSYDKNGNTTLKANPCVTDLVKINSQMVRLLDFLGIKPSRFKKEVDKSYEV